jgi:hypothetical protein
MSFIDDLKKPFNLTTIAIAVISITVSIMLYVKSKKEMIPTYMVSSSQVKIYDSKTSASGFTVIDASKKPITEDVYLLQTAFWNSGQLPIEPSAVRTPIRIHLTDCAQILEFKILKQTRPELANFRILLDTSVSQAPTEKSLFLMWDHLDPNFGARIQIIFAGQASSKLFYTGYVAGIDNFLEGAENDDLSTFQTILATILLVLLLSIAADVLKWIYSRIRLAFGKQIKEFNYRSLAAEVFCFIVLLIVVRTFFHVVAPPV